MTLLTKEKVLELGFLSANNNSHSDTYFWRNLNQNNLDSFSVNISFIKKNICISSKGDLLFFTDNDFTEERLEAILRAFQQEPLETKEVDKSLLYHIYLNSSPSLWTSLFLQKNVQICQSCLTQKGEEDCCSNPEYIPLEYYLTKCKEFSLKYAKLKRELNKLALENFNLRRTKK